MEKCNHCENNVIDAEMTKDRHGKFICSGCKMSAIYSAITIKFIDPTGIAEYMWSDEFGYIDKDDETMVSDIPAIDTFTQIGDRYVPMLRRGFSMVISNWEFSYKDGSTKVIDFLKQLTTRSIIPPFPLTIVLYQRGDFKMAVDIIVNDRDGLAYLSWKSHTGLLD
tara:strand:- start:2617 stop:3114 length:498 start_codon:yes stop_codon:yes gene_type:complete